MGVRSHEASEPTPGGDTHASVLCTDVGSMKRGWRCIHIAVLSRSSRTPTRGQALRCTARNAKPPGGVRNRRRQGTSRACDVLESNTVHSVYARACTGCIRKGEACVTKIPRQLGSRRRSHTAYACSVHSNTEAAELVEKATRNTAPEIRFGTAQQTSVTLQAGSADRQGPLIHFDIRARRQLAQTNAATVAWKALGRARMPADARAWAPVLFGVAELFVHAWATTGNGAPFVASGTDTCVVAVRSRRISSLVPPPRRPRQIALPCVENGTVDRVAHAPNSIPALVARRRIKHESPKRDATRVNEA